MTVPDPGADLAASGRPAEVTLELCLPAAMSARLWRTSGLAPLRAGRTRTHRTRIVWHDTAQDSFAVSGRALLEIHHGASRAWHDEPAVRDGRLVWPLGTPADVTPAAPEAIHEALRPLAVFDGYCRRAALLPDCGLSEVTMLDGTLTVGTATRALARLRLRGTSAAAFALARALLQELPLAVPATSLSGEVRTLLHGPAAPPPPVLHPDLDLDCAFAHVVSQLAASLAYHAPAARAGTANEPVHQMRVALRRLRSALSLFRRVVGSPELDRTRRDLGDLARALGPARDWDVFIAGTGRALGKLLPQDKAVIRLTRAARRKRAGAYAALARLLDAPEFQAMLMDLVELALARPWHGDADQDRPRLAAFARHALSRKLRQVSEAGDDLSPLPAEALHALRIRCKRLRYAAEFFAPLIPGRQTRRFLRRLAAVQERLGQLNDGAVAAGLLDELGSRGFAAGIVHGYLAARSAGGRAKAERSWRRFRRTDPFWD